MIGNKKFSLQLINAIELPDQIRLFLVCMNPQTIHGRLRRGKLPRFLFYINQR